MQLIVRGDTLEVREIQHLQASNSDEFRMRILSSLPDPLSQIDVDLSDTMAVDSSGLGTLITLGRAVTCKSHREVVVRILNPTPSMQQILELTRVYRILEIVNHEKGVSD